MSIDQKTTNRNPRSTVGTITEIYDYLRLLFARTGVPHCPECGELVSAQTPQQMVDTLLKNPERTRFQILAPVVRGRKGEFADLLELLRGDGYARALIDGEERRLSDDIKLTKQKKHTIEVVVDRLMIRDGIRQRLTDSIETALRLSKGVIVADFVDLDEKDPNRRQPFSEHRPVRTGISCSWTRSSPARSRSMRHTGPVLCAMASATSWRSTPIWSSPMIPSRCPTA